MRSENTGIYQESFQTYNHGRHTLWRYWSKFNFISSLSLFFKRFFCRLQGWYFPVRCMLSHEMDTVQFNQSNDTSSIQPKIPRSDKFECFKFIWLLKNRLQHMTTLKADKNGDSTWKKISVTYLNFHFLYYSLLYYSSLYSWKQLVTF